MNDEQEDRPAPGTMDERVAEIRARLTGVTAGPWFVWDGHGYALGGRDLCIGAGSEWLANMDHRACDKRHMHMEAGQWMSEARMFAEGHAKCAPEGDTSIMEIAYTCDHEDQFTEEQMANANFVARAREDVPFLLSVIDSLNRQLEKELAENDRLRYGDDLSSAPALTTTTASLGNVVSIEGPKIT